MNISLLRNFGLTVLFAGAMHAAPVIWDFSLGLPGENDLGSSTTTVTSSGFAVGVTGYSGTNAFNNLYRKNNGGVGNENGLGLTGFSDNEITFGSDFIQLDISALVGFTNFRIQMGSSTTGACNVGTGTDCTEGWQVFNCNLSGTACGTSVLMLGDQTLDAFSLAGPVASNRFLDIKATSGNVLVYKLVADSPAVPEPSTWLLLSGGLVGLGAFRRFRQA